MHKIWLSSLGDMAARSWVMRKNSFGAIWNYVCYRLNYGKSRSNLGKM